MAGVSGKVVSSSSALKREEVIFYDDKKKKKYRMGKFLGKVLCYQILKLFRLLFITGLNFNRTTTLVLLQGGFAKCYELVDVDTNEIFAGKIVPKSMLTKPHQKDKVFVMRPVYNCITVGTNRWQWRLIFTAPFNTSTWYNFIVFLRTKITCLYYWSCVGEE